MAAASIRIDQPTHSTQTIGVAGRARDDIELGESVTLRNADNSGVESWRWTMLAKPSSSEALLSNPVVATCSFTPDVVGTYLVRLEVNGGRVGEVHETVVIVRDADGLRIPAARESTQANYLVDGSPNPFGWHPDMEALLSHLTSRVATVYDASGVIVRDIDFTDIGSDSIADGNVELGDLTWAASGVASRLSLAEYDDTGINITHATGSTSTLAGGDTAPRLSIALSDLIPAFDPAARYFFQVAFSWSPPPNQAGERFSVGIYGAASSPWPSCSLRFAGATSMYNTTPAAPVVEAERDNTIGNSQSPDAGVLALSLDGPTTLSIWKASTIQAAPSGLTPVMAQRATNLTAAGDYNVFNHPSCRFVMALAATGATATHGVQISRLRIIRR